MATTEPQHLSLVADIGGTHARFALVGPCDERPSASLTFKVSDFPSLTSAILAYLETTDLPEAQRPRCACLAIAGPTGLDRVNITNNGWSFSQQALKQTLGLEQLRVINDFTAQAYAAPLLAPNELVSIGGGKSVNGKPIAVLGPGTGLGVGGLVFSGTSPIALFSEGGHVDFAPGDELEAEVLRYLWQRYDHVSAERLLCGSGLVNLYEALAAIHGTHNSARSAVAITEAALNNSDPLCRESVELFCAMLGSLAGNTALTLGARGGVYIAGGIVPKILDLFLTSRFRARFESKGRFQGYLASIPTRVVIAEHPGLLGAANALRQQTQP
ncbi:glucokinase [Marinobacterium mangrovicola]|uniref:Glucokinase n=2 Tax=Marinobacterium mangrovicola TaxID=1476959 RepID=A0A4R1GML0_9GAMM|nr:glucokinase [Marinobacterium mangrovicola]